MSTLSVTPTAGQPMFEGVDAVRATGGLVHIRPFAASDADALRALHARVSDRSMYLRFFGLGRAAAEKYVTLLMRPASSSHQTLTAWIGTQLVGVAGFQRSTGDVAEAALLVADDRQHQGIGTLLLEYLADVARRDGIHRFEADVLGENLVALRTLRDLGCAEQVLFEEGTARVVIDLSAEEESSTAIGARERSAEEVSLRHILAPASVAVVGAGDRPESVGHQVLRNILVGGYTGAVYPVNPHHETVPESRRPRPRPHPARRPRLHQTSPAARTHWRAARFPDLGGSSAVRRSRGSRTWRSAMTWCGFRGFRGIHHPVNRHRNAKWRRRRAVTHAGVFGLN